MKDIDMWDVFFFFFFSLIHIFYLLTEIKSADASLFFQHGYLHSDPKNTADAMCIAGKESWQGSGRERNQE